MIRIDEIYYNIFVPALQDQPRVGLHWFDPFGSTSIEDLCNVPPVDLTAKKRYVFWDQEVLHRDRVKAFFKEFKVRHLGPVNLVHSEKNSEDVYWACDTYGLWNSYYFFHGWAALDWYRGYNRTFLSVPFSERKFEKTFLCPNNIIGGARVHRLFLFAEMATRNLVNDNFISFPDQCPFEGKTVNELCKDYHMPPVDSSILPLRIDNETDYAGSSHRVTMWEQAAKSMLHVVTETAFHGRKLHLTEKTFKPIVLQQPFVLVSCRHSLEYLRSYGFKTFGEFWNEDYDDYPDETRIERIGQLLQDLCALSPREKAQLQKHLAPIVEHNFQWFYGQDFESVLWKELQNMIAQW